MRREEGGTEHGEPAAQASEGEAAAGAHREPDRRRGAKGSRLGAARACALGALALSLGAGAGFSIWALLSAAYLLCDLVWDGVGGALGLPAFPLLACTLGGALIGLWNARFDSAPKPLDEVMAEVRAKGGYSVGRVVPASVSFLAIPASLLESALSLFHSPDPRSLHFPADPVSVCFPVLEQYFLLHRPVMRWVSPAVPRSSLHKRSLSEFPSQKE